MVNMPPDPNLPPNPDERETSGRFQDRDEMIAVLLAFLGIGTILLWGWTRGDQRDLFRALPSAPLADQPLSRGETRLDETELEPIDRPRPIPFFNSPNEALEEELNDQEASAVPRSRRINSLVPQPPLREEPQQTDRTPATRDVPQETLSATPDTAPDEPTTLATETLPPLSITDVSEDYWAYPYIVSLYENGFLPDLPEGQLQPDKELTRAEFAALLNSSFVGEAARERSLSFTDIPATFWAAAAIEQVVDAGSHSHTN
jgi:hypothetical protein